MAYRFEPTKAMIKGWRKWCASRPAVVRANAERFPPWELLLMKSTGKRVFTMGFNEDGTISVAVTGTYNLILHERQVFGISPDDLERCELPPADEPVGAILDAQQMDENIDALRVLVRPDLWIMGPDGKAVRKQ